MSNWYKSECGFLVNLDMAAEIVMKKNDEDPEKEIYEVWALFSNRHSKDISYGHILYTFRAECEASVFIDSLYFELKNGK